MTDDVLRWSKQSSMTPEHDVERFIRRVAVTRHRWPYISEIAAALDMTGDEVKSALVILENEGRVRTHTVTLIVGVE